MSDFIDATSLDKVPSGSSTTITIGGKDIALFNVAGTVYAMDDGCAHAAASLGSGKLEGNVVTCRAQGWKYDVTTGHVLAVPGFGVSTYPVKIENGKILVAVKPLI